LKKGFPDWASKKKATKTMVVNMTIMGALPRSRRIQGQKRLFTNPNFPCLRFFRFGAGYMFMPCWLPVLTDPLFMDKRLPRLSIPIPFMMPVCPSVVWIDTCIMKHGNRQGKPV
jgi:hypothetical protein